MKLNTILFSFLLSSALITSSLSAATEPAASGANKGTKASTAPSTFSNNKAPASIKADSKAKAPTSKGKKIVPIKSKEQSLTEALSSSRKAKTSKNAVAKKTEADARQAALQKFQENYGKVGDQKQIKSESYEKKKIGNNLYVNRLSPDTKSMILSINADIYKSTYGSGNIEADDESN